MTREQYEKLKEYIKYLAGLANNKSALGTKELEKELDNLMFPEGNKG